MRIASLFAIDAQINNFIDKVYIMDDRENASAAFYRLGRREKDRERNFLLKIDDMYEIGENFYFYSESLYKKIRAVSFWQEKF